MPKRYDEYEMEVAGSLSRPIQKSGGKRSHNNNGGINQNMPRASEGNRNISDEHSRPDQDEQFNNSVNESIENCRDECEEGIENNTRIIQYVSDNVSVVLKTLMNVLPLTTVNEFASKVQNANSDDYQWAQDLVYQRLGPAGSTNSEQGKNEIVNNVKASDTASASASSSQEVKLTNYASVAATIPDATNQNVLNTIIRQNIDDMNRKKNIVITGMDEDYDDDVLVGNMLQVMGCGFLYHDINKRPTRLGMKRNNRTRALKVEMNNEEAVEVIMKCKKELRNRNENFYKIYVNRDLRKEEREKEIEQRKARNSRIWGDSAAGAGSNIGITAGVGGTPTQQITPNRGQEGSSALQATPSSGQSAGTGTPKNETGTDLAPTTVGIIREIEVEEGVVITAEGDNTEITNDHVREGSDTIAGSADEDGGNPPDPDQGSVPQIDQVSTDNGLGNGDGTPGTQLP